MVLSRDVGRVEDLDRATETLTNVANSVAVEVIDDDGLVPICDLPAPIAGLRRGSCTGGRGRLRRAALRTLVGLMDGGLRERLAAERAERGIQRPEVLVSPTTAPIGFASSAAVTSMPSDTPIYEVGKAEPVDFIDLSEMEHCGPRPEELIRQCVSYYVQDTGWPGTYSVQDLEHDLDRIGAGRVPERLPVYNVFREPRARRAGL